MLQQADHRNDNLIVNVGGKLLGRRDGGVSPFDSVVQGGDAVWEGLRLYDGKIFKLDEHLDRMRDSARAIGFEMFGSVIPSHDTIIAQIRRTLEANEMRDGVHIRLTLTRGEKITSGMDPRLNQSGPTLIVLAEYKSPVYSKKGLTFVTSSVRRSPPDMLDPKIHHNNLLSSIMAKIEANVAGADSALMLDTHGFIAEAHGSHVFFVRDGKVFTPTTDACPEGITRQTVIELCQANEIPVGVRNVSLPEACNADEMFCTGTMGEIAGVTILDGRTIGPQTGDEPGGVGPITVRISDLYIAETARSGYKIV